MKFNLRSITFIAAIVAIYAVLTIAVAPLSYGMIQFRVSEALTILPFFTPLAIPGLFIGVLIANFFSSLGMVDVIVGSAATLIAAIWTYRIKNKWLVPIPAILVNGIIIGAEIGILEGKPSLIPIAMLWVGIGELGVTYLLGMPLLLALEKRKHLFKID
ncbi:QueT transporter family protein [Tepidibacillus marianensis]|uniref:QueT transporter family protein n=1 Tax=Tepidibacillus marianensis TaxID=3131995 RepID=UPI0030CD236E